MKITCASGINKVKAGPYFWESSSKNKWGFSVGIWEKYRVWTVASLKKIPNKRKRKRAARVLGHPSIVSEDVDEE